MQIRQQVKRLALIAELRIANALGSTGFNSE